MIQTTLQSGALQDLRAALSGQLICTNGDDYDSTRKVWNGMIDRYPAAIVRCIDVADVISAIEFARSQHLPVAVRSGGHRVSGSSVCNEGIVTYGSSCTSPHSLILIQHIHGAASCVASTETAFALREESYVTSIVAAWDGGAADRHIGWTRACWGALAPFASRGVYVNFLGNEGEEAVRAACGVNYERLVALKNWYDPANFFALNQNIKPKDGTNTLGEPPRRFKVSLRYNRTTER